MDKKISCVNFYSGQIILGEVELPPVEMQVVIVKLPRAVITKPTGHGTEFELTLTAFLGNPDYIQYRNSDILTIYYITDKALISQYMREIETMNSVISKNNNNKLN